MNFSESSFSASEPTAFASAEEIEQESYRAVSRLAIAALAIGVASPLALAGPLLLAMPVVGIAVAWLALRQLAEAEGELVGRGAALVGLALSITFLVAAPTRQWAGGWLIHREARPWAEQWFKLLAQDQPYLAHQLSLATEPLAGSEQDIEDIYLARPRLHAALEDFVAEPVVRALLALGDRAEVNHWGNVARHSASGDDYYVVQSFTVSYDEEGRRKTFFVRLTVARKTNRRTGEVRWSINAFEGGGLPGEPSTEP